MGTTEYWYDADQQRRLRLLASGTREYFVPGPGLVPLAEYRKATGGSRELVREYIYAGDRLIASVGLEPSLLASVTWTDDPIVAGVTEVKAAHLTELRDAVNAARTAHGLAAASWTDATVTPGVTVIQAVHIAELRTAIDAVYTTAGATPPSYTDPTLTQGVTAVKAVHFTELRAARANAPAAEVTATRFYHLDALGSVRAVTDDAGATVRRHDYAPFGEEPTPTTGSDARRFTGKERDAETGLDYFSARYYLSTAGRFTTVDPYSIVSEAEDEADLIAYLSVPQRWNRYGYSLNNPGKYKDPDGKNPLLILWGVYEVGSAIYDVYTAYKTVRDQDASGAEKSVAVGGAILSAALPGGGYGTGGKTVARRILDASGAQLHHIVTNKNILGGFTAQFCHIFDGAGMSLNDGANIIILRGHKNVRLHANTTKWYWIGFVMRLAASSGERRPIAAQWKTLCRVLGGSSSTTHRSSGEAEMTNTKRGWARAIPYGTSEETSIVIDPVRVDYRGADLGQFYVLNPLSAVAALDRSASAYSKFSVLDAAAHLTGQIKTISRAVLDDAKLAGAPQLFRLAENLRWLIVGPELRSHIERAGLTGLWFKEVEVN